MQIFRVEAVPQVQHPRLQVKRAFIGIHEYGEKQTSFQYSSKQLILTIHGKPSKSLAFALNEVLRLSVSHTVLLTFYLYERLLHEKMSNYQAEEPFLLFSTLHPGYLGRGRLQLDQFEKGNSHHSIMTT